MPYNVTLWWWWQWRSFFWFEAGLKLESVRGPCNLAALIMMMMMSASADEKWHRWRESRQTGGDRAYVQVKKLVLCMGWESKLYYADIHACRCVHVCPLLTESVTTLCAVFKYLMACKGFFLDMLCLHIYMLLRLGKQLCWLLTVDSIKLWLWGGMGFLQMDSLYIYHSFRWACNSLSGP